MGVTLTLTDSTCVDDPSLHSAELVAQTRGSFVRVVASSLISRGSHYNNGTASEGGALYGRASSIEVDGGSFNYNHADSGGAIH